MEIQEIYTKLCWYDKRNPENLVLDSGKKPRQDCYCDNCFTGRDKLAVELLRFKKLAVDRFIPRKKGES